MPTGRVLYTHFPYCIQRVEGGWIILNRNYKPLGGRSGEWVAYDGHPTVLEIDHRSIAAIERAALKVGGDANGKETIWFYNDGCVPWRSDRHMADYLARLEPLMRAKVLSDHC